MGISREQIERIRSKLRATPKAPPSGVDTSKQEAVRLLVREIETLQSRGWSLEQIGEMLRGDGLVVATPTLKSYLSRAKAARQRGREGRSKIAAGGAGARAAGGVVGAVAADPAQGAAPKKTAIGPIPSAKAASGVVGADVVPVGPATAAAKADAAAATTERGALRSGKDAFLIKDKDSY